MSYQADRELESATLQSALTVLSKMYKKIEIASEHLDVSAAADVVCDSWHHAVRVRRHGFLSRYPWDVTLRYARESGTRTEFSKIMGGHADRFFYAHLGADGNICHWWLISLSALRRAGPERVVKLSAVIPNTDHCTWLIAINLSRLADEGFPVVVDAHQRFSRDKYAKFFVPF